MSDATEVWFDAVAKVAAGIEGIKGAIAYAAGSGGQGATVRPIPRNLADTPAAVLYYRGGTPVPGGAERIKHRVQLRIYVPRTDLGDSYGLLVSFPRRVLTAYQARAKAFLEVASVMVVEFGGIESEEWPPRVAFEAESSGRWFLVLPVELEVVENYHNATFQPQ